MIFFVIGIIGMITSLIMLYGNLLIDIVIASFIITLSASLMGCGMYYSRKIYKKCIRNEFHFPSEGDNSELNKFGITIYFIIRPIFTLAITMIIFIGFMLTVSGIVSNYDVLSKNFTLFVGFYSFFTGYNIGLIIDKLDKYHPTTMSNVVE
jgi:hypothetical protein